MIEKIDKKDKLILWELYQNARLPYTKIAQKVQLPKETVKYRILRLEKAGILKKYYAIANSSKFGLIFYEIYLRLQGMPDQLENENLNKLSKNPFTCWLITTSGRFNVCVTFLVQNHSQFYHCYNFVRSLYKGYIKDLQINFSVEGQQFEYPFFKDFSRTPVRVASEEVTPINFDRTKTRLLEILTENCRTPIREMALELKVSEPTVRTLIKWLEKKSYIQNYTVLLHPGKCGFFFYIMLIKLELPDLEIENYIKKIPEIYYLKKGAAFFDIKVEFYTSSENRIYEIEDELFHQFGKKISSIDIMHVKKEHTVRYFVDASTENKPI